MSALPERLQRRNVRRFIALHVAAVVVLYAIALRIGGGLAPPPFPAASQLVAQTAASATRIEALPGPAAHAAPEPVPALLQRVEVAPPWSIDAQGRVRIDLR